MNIKFTHNPFKLYPWRWYYSPQGEEFFDVIAWCNQTYGPITSGGKWDLRSGWLSFADKKDADWFTLRWS